MKQKLLPLVIAGITAASASGFAAASEDMPTVYGKVNLSLHNNDYEDATGETEVDNWELNSNASRVGVKGSYGLTDSVKAIYKLEYEIDVDGDGDTFKQRNTYVGIQGGLGTILGGRHDTPLKLAQGKVDRFNDLPLGDIKNVLSGETRASNIVMYSTPKFGDAVSFTAAFIPGEDDGTASEDDDGVADGQSYALNAEFGGFTVALAYDSEVESGSGALDDYRSDIMRLVGEFNFDAFKFGALIQSGELSDDDDNAITEADEEDGFIVSGEWAFMEKTSLKLQYGDSTAEDGNGDEIDTTQIAVGLDYKFNKKAKVYAYIADIEQEGDNIEDNEDMTFAIGTEVKF